MHEKRMLYPVPIKRKLRPIVDLFSDKTFEVCLTFWIPLALGLKFFLSTLKGLKVEDGSIFNLKQIIEWFLPRLKDYKKVMDPKKL